MKRRSFIQSAGGSALSIGTVSSIQHLLPFRSEIASLTQWLNQISLSSSVMRRSDAKVAKKHFVQITEENNKCLSLSGYHRMNETCYFFGSQEEHCFYPMVMQHQASGTQDILLSVFRRDVDDRWCHVQTLSRYQIEAMIKAYNSLHPHSLASIQDWVFPVEKDIIHSKAGSYLTKEGVVSVITRIKNGKAITTCAVTNRTGEIFKETFTSNPYLIA